MCADLFVRVAIADTPCVAQVVAVLVVVTILGLWLKTKRGGGHKRKAKKKPISKARREIRKKK